MVDMIDAQKRSGSMPCKAIILSLLFSCMSARIYTRVGITNNYNLLYEFLSMRELQLIVMIIQ